MYLGAGLNISAYNSRYAGIVGPTAAELGHSYIGTYEDPEAAVEAPTATRTIAIDLGTPATNRVIGLEVALQMTAAVASFTSITVTPDIGDPVVMNQLVALSHATRLPMVAIYSGAVPLGTTAVVTIVTSTTSHKVALGVHRMTAYNGTASDTASANADGAVSVTNLIDVVEDGVILTAIGNRFSTDPSWSGASEDFDLGTLSASGNISRLGGAHYGPAVSLETNHSITASFSSDTVVMVSASFNPT